MNGKFARHILIVIAALAMVSCMKETIVTRDAISFAPVASKPTKAIIEGTTYPVGETFAVSAFYNGLQPYFSGVTATKASSYWETESPEYWPLDGQLVFHAYSPASASGVSLSASGVSATGYTITTSQQMTTDLCYASYTESDCSNHTDAVPLAFSHALSQIVFRVKAAAYYSNATISMTSIGLSGIYSVGDFSEGAWSNQKTEYTYALSNTPTTLTYSGSTPVVADVCSYLFLPQAFGPNAKMHVGYSIVQNVSGTEYTLTNHPVEIPLDGSLSQWEPGKKYIYTINIGMDNVITFTASSVSWQDENANIIVEEN